MFYSGFHSWQPERSPKKTKCLAVRNIFRVERKTQLSKPLIEFEIFHLHFEYTGAVLSKKGSTLSQVLSQRIILACSFDYKQLLHMSFTFVLFFISSQRKPTLLENHNLTYAAC